MRELDRNRPSSSSRPSQPSGAGAAFSIERFERLLKWAFNANGRGPQFFRLFLVVNPILIFFVVIVMGGFGDRFWTRYLYALIVGECVSMTCYSLSIITAIVGHKILKVQVPRKTFIWISVAGMFPGLWIGFKVSKRIASLLGNQTEPASYSDYGSGFAIGSLIFGVIVLIDMWSTTRRHAKKLETETLHAKLSALSAQMNPHLLFNALNTIASTISTDPLLAEETTLKLSELYRGILNSSKRNSHSIREELDICRSYLSVESARFGDRLKWTIHSDPKLEPFEIPTLLIQPLVENAVKHGLSQKIEGGTIRVDIIRQETFVHITIEDDGIGFGNSTSKSGTGTGLSSCKTRLELAYQGLATFQALSSENEKGSRIVIRIPIHPNGFLDSGNLNPPLKGNRK